jgi:hypothetical protein
MFAKTQHFLAAVNAQIGGSGSPKSCIRPQHQPFCIFARRLLRNMKFAVINHTHHALSTSTIRPPL